MNEEKSGLTELAIALGRVEAKVDRIESLDGRLRDVEKKVEGINAQTKPKAPWYAVVGAVVGIVTGLGSLIGLLMVLNTVASALAVVK